jgi:hypothetical protein
MRTDMGVLRCCVKTYRGFDASIPLPRLLNLVPLLGLSKETGNVVKVIHVH